MTKKKEVLHINYADDDGKVYCRKAKDVIDLHEGFQIQTCRKCPFFRGTAQGEGVECEWKDPRPHVGDIIATSNAEEEYNDISKHDDTMDIEDKVLIEKLAVVTEKAKNKKRKDDDEE